ncbi:General transcription and DNA repair factor IIH subunit tfb2 [Cucumispora dikerogammari]|nr:General transcription and DNA repair factor IIH subunit tfb2 [Cucumispora dikerogammari]
MSIISVFGSFINKFSVSTDTHSNNNNKLMKSKIMPILILKVLSESHSHLILKLICEKLRSENNSNELNLQLEELKALKIINTYNDIIVLNVDFRISLLKFANKKIESKTQYQPPELNFSKKIGIKNSFNSILTQFIENSGFPKIMREIFLHSKLVNKSGSITKLGFDFLLKSTKEQLWFLILEILDVVNNYEIIEFVFELCIYKPNCVYYVEYITDYETVLEYLTYLGIISYNILSDNKNTKKIEINTFPLISYLTTHSAQSDKFLIIETNYKIYAYTTQKHQIAVLKLFCTNLNFLSDFIIGEINENSVKNSFEKGISAEQINNFLDSHCKNICFTIKEQIQIWEAKSQRFKYEKAVLLEDFGDLNEFRETVDICKEKGVLLFYDEEAEIVIVKTGYGI